MRRVWSGSAKLVGWDVDPKAIEASHRALSDAARLEVRDSLLLDPNEDFSLRPTAVIANPPWGAKVGLTPEELRGSGLQLAVGQFDVFELFIERLISAYPNGCTMAFIVPDSVVLPEHERLRRLLLERTRLLLLARLGEGFFPGIFRGTMILILETGDPNQGDLVECLRLIPEARRAVIDGSRSLLDVQRELSHYVRQERFTGNARTEFNLDLREGEQTVEKIAKAPLLDWSRCFNLGRGVEIGKRGMTLRCASCGFYRVLPKADSRQVACANCKRLLDLTSITPEQIIQPITETPRWPWRRMVVGEDVSRYRVQASREILSELPGVKYGVRRRTVLRLRGQPPWPPTNTS